MTQLEEHEALVEDAAKAIYAVIPNGGTVLEQTTSITQDGLPEWRQRGVDDTWEEAPDRHDCCRELARAVLAVIAEKAKKWPTERMYNARLNDWRTMFAASPLVKPEDPK